MIHPLLDDYYALDTAEERLEWICERVPRIRLLEPDQCTPELRVPNCLSGVWIRRDEGSDGRVHFTCRADSPVVGGIAALLCDLFSDQRPEDLSTFLDDVVRPLRLDALLTTNRKRAVETLCATIVAGSGPK
jgi:cysteine desulfuration protein SufE